MPIKLCISSIFLHILIKCSTNLRQAASNHSAEPSANSLLSCLPVSCHPQKRASKFDAPKWRCLNSTNLQPNQSPNHPTICKSLHRRLDHLKVRIMFDNLWPSDWDPLSPQAMEGKWSAKLLLELLKTLFLPEWATAGHPWPSNNQETARSAGWIQMYSNVGIPGAVGQMCPSREEQKAASTGRVSWSKPRYSRFLAHMCIITRLHLSKEKFLELRKLNITMDSIFFAYVPWPAVNEENLMATVSANAGVLLKASMRWLSLHHMTQHVHDLVAYSDI